jgi:hypothetical protein
MSILCVDLLGGEEWESENCEALPRACSRMFKIRIASLWKKIFRNNFSNSTYVLKKDPYVHLIDKQPISWQKLTLGYFVILNLNCLYITKCFTGVSYRVFYTMH